MLGTVRSVVKELFTLESVSKVMKDDIRRTSSMTDAA